MEKSDTFSTQHSKQNKALTKQVINKHQSAKFFVEQYLVNWKISVISRIKVFFSFSPFFDNWLFVNGGW